MVRQAEENVMTWLNIVLRIIPAIIKLAQIAEKVFDDVPDSGTQKKQMVIDAIRALVEGLSGVTFTPELWAKISGIINPLIDIVAGFLFPSEKK